MIHNLLLKREQRKWKRTFEKQLESVLCRNVRLAGGLCIKLAPGVSVGIPDRLVLMPNGISAFVELKREGEKPTELQKAVHIKLRTLGYEVYICDTLASVTLAIETLQKYATTRISKESNPMAKEETAMRTILGNGVGQNNNLSNGS